MQSGLRMRNIFGVEKVFCAESVKDESNLEGIGKFRKGVGGFAVSAALRGL